MPSAYSIKVRGVVQGVGFRPFVYRLALENQLTGWVLNEPEGVEIHLEGHEPALQAFVEELRTRPPKAAVLSGVHVLSMAATGFNEFTIRTSNSQVPSSARISPDLPVCDDCLVELFDQTNRRFHYPYINCTNCGPRYTVIRGLPYDRQNTTMADWKLDPTCSAEYLTPSDRRFHAQPTACPHCGPRYIFSSPGEVVRGNDEWMVEAVKALIAGKVLAIKGLGGYHLACDAKNAGAVAAIRERKYRKEKPFAIMAKNEGVARALVHLSSETERLLKSDARPIVLAAAKMELSGVAPDNDEFGVMLPYTPLHHLLFAAGAPEVLVMTSANRSSEPIAYTDEDALQELSGIADAFLIGERPIARRVDDSVARAGAFGPTILRRARGYAPGSVATLPAERPILALGADLKNAITLVVDGQTFVSQHIGDLNHYSAFRAFQQTIEDFLSMYEIRREEMLVVHDAHPEYVSTLHAVGLPGCETLPVQHHRAHIASVLAESGTWRKRVIGVSCDGAGYGDDGAIWGGEIFAGSVAEGFDRVAHLRPAALPGGDAAAAFPVQAAAGFLAQLPDLPNLMTPPFSFPSRYRDATQLLRKNVRTFETTSVGRLFDTAAALLGFTREISFEGQAAMWLESIARRSRRTNAYRFPVENGELDFRPLLEGVVGDRVRGRDLGEIARAFHLGVATGLRDVVVGLADRLDIDTVVLSGGVFQNELLMSDVKILFESHQLEVRTNHAVPSNDGGISLGQAAIATFASRDSSATGRI
jgi:hydrogenase maturation protein HypF